MKTIEERAKLASQDYEDDGYSAGLYMGYIVGAKEQKVIDEEESLKLESVWVKEAQINHDDVANYKQGYHDAIENACEWLEPYIACGVSPEGTYSFVARFRKAMEEYTGEARCLDCK